MRTVVGLGWLIRTLPLLLAGPTRYPIDYDQGVYFTAAALFAEGHALYGDVVFVHPPGLPYLLAPVSSLASPDVAFGLARLIMTVIGAVNIVLIWNVAKRHLGPGPAVAASLVYAFHPVAITADRGIFLEPY